MTERRKSIRCNAELNVEYKTLTLNPLFGKTLAKDLSREGIRLGLKHAVPVGTLLELSVNVPGDNLPVFAMGKVAWADGLEAGLKLTKISVTDKSRMMEYAYKEWLGTKKKDISCLRSENSSDCTPQ